MQKLHYDIELCLDPLLILVFKGLDSIFYGSAIFYYQLYIAWFIYYSLIIDKSIIKTISNCTIDLL